MHNQYPITPFIQPKGRSCFGPRIHPVTNKPSFHNGIDIPCEVGTPYCAIEDGVVAISKCNSGGISKGYGYYIVVEHKTGITTLGAHLMKQGLPIGTRVKKGDIIGYTGNTGRSTAPHLHFEIRAGNCGKDFFKTSSAGRYLNSFDPMSYLGDQADYKSILKKKTDNPELWYQFIEENADHPVGKWLPALIEKIAK